MKFRKFLIAWFQTKEGLLYLLICGIPILISIILFMVK